MRPGAALAALVCLAAPPAATEPPQVDHQPAQCVVTGQPLSLCATIGDDRQVAKARLYFRAAGERYFFHVPMEFGGLRYCAAVPPLRRGQARALEYYIHAIDDQFELQRTATHTLPVLPQSACEFPPVADGPPASRPITIHATHRKQGTKVPRFLEAAEVVIVAAER